MDWAAIGDSLAKNWPMIVRDLMGIAGFGITIFTLLRTRTAAIAARDAAQEANAQVRKRMAGIDALSTLTAAAAKIDQIYEFQTRESWERVPGFYKEARLLLAKLKSETLILNSRDRQYIHNAVTELGTIELSIQTRIIEPGFIDDMPQINQIITRHSEEFARMEIELRGEQISQ